MRTFNLHIAAALTGILLLTGCAPTKRVPAGSYLLNRNRVVMHDKSVDPVELEAIIKQKPNKRIVGMRFHLAMYGLPDPERMAGKKARKDQRTDERNEQRAERGKPAKPYKRTKGEWLREDVGEPPVLLNPELTERSVEQMRMYLNKEGWFRAVVTDTVRDRPRRRIRLRGEWGKPYDTPKRDVEFHVNAGRPYQLRPITYTADDPRISEHVRSTWENSLLHTGDRFDADVLDQERSRIADQLRNIGYLYFTRDMVNYQADTTVGDHQVDIALRLERVNYPRSERGLEGTSQGTPYTINAITVTMARPVRDQTMVLDSTEQAGYLILKDEFGDFKTSALLNDVFLKPNERFSQNNADRTYRRLTALQVFDRVDITYDTTDAGGKGRANALINVVPGRSQSLSLEGAGTNRGGALGTSVSLGYRHRNLFRTMVSLQAQFTLGLEAQQSLTSASQPVEDATTGSLTSSGLFNTVDIGPELTLRFPYFLLPVKRERFSGQAAPRTLLSAIYNYQRRPDYSRNLAKLSFGYEWLESRTRTMSFFPAEVNVIRIPLLSPEFQRYLQEANDPVLTDSYTDHLIAGLRGQLVTNTRQQGSAAKRTSYFSRLSVEWAGHPLGLPIPRWLSAEATDTSGNTFNTVAGVRYAEYVKVDADLRWLHIIHSKGSVAFRAAGGFGVPYGNLGVLPFESSFFVGGANGLRAWRARSIGPGSYSAPLIAFDRIGEIRMEGNVEYRFKLISYLEGAFFADIGNIWNWNEDPAKPGSGFSKDFISELAVGTGFGARLNFDFLIVRFDLGLQTKDPSLPKGERWLFQPKDEFEARAAENGLLTTYKPQFNFNLGIGYPF
ncbi:MAG: BamA/TamA family outer membrane protein [Flavobacteriales bacterium]